MFSRKIKGQWFLLIVTLFIAQACFATAPSYDELAGCTISDTDAGGTIDGEEDVELEEAGETIELTGTIEESDGGWILRTNSGQTYPITEDSKIPKEKEGTFFAVTVLVPQSEGWTTAIKFVEKKNAFVEGVGRFLSNLFTMQNSLPDRRPQEWKLPKAVEKEGKDFLAAYANYVKAAHKTLRESYAKKAIETCSSCKSPYNVLTQLNRATYGTNKKTYDEAMSKLATYVKALVSKGVLSKVDSKVTYIAVDKVAFLVAVVDKKTDEALYIVPIAYGAHPSGAPKEANGDLKSPNVTDSGKLAADATPYFIGRRYGGTIVKGMTVRCMGLSSNDKADAYWVQYGMNIAIHGTPSWWSMGLRASHGCFRVQEERVKLIYELTSKDTPVVIYGVK